MTLVSGKVWVVEKFARGHPKRTCEMRVGWIFRRFSTNMSSYLESGAFYTQRYYGTVIGNHNASYRMVSLSMTLSEPWPGFQGHGSFKRRVYPKRRILQTQLLYRTLIGNHRHVSIGNLAIQLTTPLLLRKPCKLFASVARVCQRQLGFLVFVNCTKYIPWYQSNCPQSRSQLPRFPNPNLWAMSLTFRFSIACEL